MKNKLSGIYTNIHTWSLKWSDTRWGVWALFLCAFADASFLPLPTPMFFLALVLLNIKKAYKYAIFGTLGTVTGAVAGYAIGYFAWLNGNGEFTRIAQFFLNNIPGFSVEVYDKIQVLYTRWDFWILFFATALPVPYKIFSISSGVFDINLVIFMVATLLSQGIKFFLLGFMAVKLGPEIKKLFHFRLKPVAIITTTFIAIATIVIIIL